MVPSPMLLGSGCVPYVNVQESVPSLAGSVSDAATGKPLADAELEIERYGSFHTDSQGKYEIPAKKEWTFFRFYTFGGIVDEPYHPFIGDFMAVSHPGYGRELVSMYGPIPEYGQDYRHIRLTHGGSNALDLRIYQPHLRP